MSMEVVGRRDSMHCCFVCDPRRSFGIGMPESSLSRKSCMTALSPNKAQRNKQLAKLIKLHLRPGLGLGQVVDVVYKVGLVKSLLDAMLVVLKSQETLVQIKAPVTIVGDLHGQFTDLRRIIFAEGYPPATKYVFLGDYIDRGRNSLECIILLFAYKVLYPNSVVLLRGNHECREVNRTYGFQDELQRKGLIEIFNDMNNVFDYLPLAALVSDRVLCMHGGISQYISSLEQIRKLRRPINTELETTPDIVMDLLWADPSLTTKGYQASDRGVSNLFGMDALEKFCKTLKIDLVVRGHQVVERGFERFGGQKTHLVTVFSAPNYCNEQDNCAAVMRVSDSLGIHFSVLKPCADSSYLAERETSRLTTPRVCAYPFAKGK